MPRPPIQYAEVDGQSIGYAVSGHGACDALFLNTLMCSVDAVWEHPAHLRSWRACAPDLRIAMFDHRGYGISDAVDADERGALRGRIDDALAVADAAGMSTFSIIAELEQTELALRLVIDHPERVNRLVLINAMAAAVNDEDYTTGLHLNDELIDMLHGLWGTGRVIPFMSPGLSGDDDFTGRLERLGGGRGELAQYLRALRTFDVRHLLGLVCVPTLVVHTGDYLTNVVEESRYLAAHIPGAELFEAAIPDGSFYWGAGAIDAFIGFLAVGVSNVTERELATVMFTDIVDSTQQVTKLGDAEWKRTLDFLDDLVSDRVRKHGGRVVKQTGDGHFAEFARPTDAVRAAVAINKSSQVLGVELRAGVHSGEVERRTDGDLGGISVHVAARVAHAASAGQVLVSRTVRDLIAGGEFTLTDQGEHTLKGVDGEWRLFDVRL